MILIIFCSDELENLGIALAMVLFHNEIGAEKKHDYVRYLKAKLV